MVRAKLDKSVSSNQSVEKVFKIIELMSENREPIRLQQIAEELDMHPTTALRFLYTLMQSGYVEQDQETLKYYLTFKICAIANKVKSNNPISYIAKPYLIALSKKLKESVCLAIEKDMTVIYIDVVDGPDQMLKTMQRIGNIAPMHCTGVGKLMLLDKSEQEIDEMIEKKGLTKFTEHTFVTKESLMEELKEISKLGYAFDNEECEIGARCVAVPIKDYTGKTVAGISVTGSIFKITDDFVNNNIKHIFEVAKSISSTLGY
ncbi:IclR family transcriptional regulator [Clostridium sp. DJ247]|uniref:IclR family transcriptional regulator n=1 Tax=Clostridium sp. DJ247 TaxID=2726188 RepID=UPI00162376F8|nr:IclR family transcriptional regulator [Clostridium sp. DJ247]MBC2579763.1 IclR family transcriptional regulator [Clostridium sp. DJ247]